MSYDVIMEGVDLYWNYTSNCVAIWEKAMPDTAGLEGLDGMRAGVAAIHLYTAMTKMIGNPQEYRALEPANGWGSFDSQLIALLNLYEACQQNPQAIISVSW